jgi:hypothetical protein
MALAIGTVVVSHAALASPKVMAPVGVVVYAEGAQVSQVAAATGASLYAGDTLTTGERGSLRVRFGTSQLMLGPATVVKLAEAPIGVAAVLQMGVVRFASVGSPIEFRVIGAIIDPQQGTAGEIVIVGPSEFKIASTKGNLDVEIDGEVKIVGEGTAYDVTVPPGPDTSHAKHSGRDKKAIWIPISLILLLTGLLLTAATLSCSKL